MSDFFDELVVGHQIIIDIQAIFKNNLSQKNCHEILTKLSPPNNTIFLFREREKRMAKILFGIIYQNNKNMSPSNPRNFNDFKTVNFAPPPSFTTTFSALSILTNREIEIIRLLSTGASAKLISETLNLSHKTIYSHRDKISKKLNLKNKNDFIFFINELSHLFV
ncbi:TPA: response regulator transcription factor [Raoultella planticola]